MRRITILFLLLILTTLGLYAQTIAHEFRESPKPYDPVLPILNRYVENAHYGAWDFLFDLGKAQIALQKELDGTAGVNPRTLLHVIDAAIELRARAELFDVLADSLDKLANAVDEPWSKEFQGEGAKYKDEIALLRDNASAVEPTVRKGWERIFGESMPQISFREASGRLARLVYNSGRVASANK